VIVQFTDIINRNNGINNITDFSDFRFFHDRVASIPDTIEYPKFGGKITNEREIYILHFNLNEMTKSKKIRIRVLNSRILNFTKGIERSWRDEILIDVENNIDKPLFICFDCRKTYGSWFLTFGNENGWRNCSVNFNYIALLRASKPLDDYSMELPRFIINPSFGYEPIVNDLIGSVGQPYGRTIRQLKTISVEFLRVKVNVIDEYYNKVSLTKPHFIIPFPEDVENVSPIWGILTQPPKYTKRNDNNWYFNLTLTWKEVY